MAICCQGMTATCRACQFTNGNLQEYCNSYKDEYKKDVTGCKDYIRTSDLVIIVTFTTDTSLSQDTLKDIETQLKSIFNTANEITVTSANLPSLFPFAYNMHIFIEYATDVPSKPAMDVLVMLNDWTLSTFLNRSAQKSRTCGLLRCSHFIPGT